MRNTVKSLGRALSLLRVLRTPPEGTSLAELCAATSLPKGTVHRLLATLVEHDFVERVGTHYRIGVQCFVTGNAFLGHLDLRARALPYLFDMRNRTGEAAQMAILEQRQVVYIERVQAKAPVAVLRAQVGAVLLAYCTALGKALLAFSPHQTVEDYLRSVPLKPLTDTTITNRTRFRAELAEIRRVGYALDRGERSAEVRCIAAPVFDHEAKLIAAVSVAGPVWRMPARLDGSGMAYEVVETAAKISSALGCTAHLADLGTGDAPPGSGGRQRRLKGALRHGLRDQGRSSVRVSLGRNAAMRTREGMR